jgi:hypothetical protein
MNLYGSCLDSHSTSTTIMELKPQVIIGDDEFIVISEGVTARIVGEDPGR